MNFNDIPQFPHSSYRVDVSLNYLEEHLEHWNDRKSPLIMNPEWQRGHVWTKKQQVAFMEYFLKGGTTGREVYFNCSSWGGKYDTPIYCLDGLQRVTAALAFVRDEIKVYGEYYSKYEGRGFLNTGKGFHFNMLALKTKRELLKVYIDFNSGGTPHNPKEIKRVEEMIAACPENEIL